jgi:hypothetical protein
MRSDQQLAAIITPAANPSMPSSNFLFMVLKKKTIPAPRAVTNQVNMVAVNACQIGLSPMNHSTIKTFFLLLNLRLNRII